MTESTGAVVYAGGGPNELMAGTHRFNAGIAARGRIYIANDNKVYAFAAPGGTPTPTPTCSPTPTASTPHPAHLQPQPQLRPRRRPHLHPHQDLFQHLDLARIRRLAPPHHDTSAFDRKHRVFRVRACASGRAARFAGKMFSGDLGPFQFRYPLSALSN